VVAVKRSIALVTVTATMLLGFVIVTEPAQGKVFGPNGQIVFAREDPAIDDLTAFTINPDGTHESALLPGLPGECPRWSPDGTKITVPALTEDGQVTVATVNADGTGYTLLGPAPDPLLNLGCSTWSPDGTRLAVEGFNDEHPELAGIYTERSSDGGDLVRVTDNPFDDADLVGDYSPDGTQISFSRAKPIRGGDAFALFVVNTDGSGLRQLTPYRVAGESSSWSPDGKQILINSRLGALIAVNVDGTGLRVIPIQGVRGVYFVFGPGWSPDGTRIVFPMFLPSTGQVDIFTVRANGTDLVQVTDTPDGEEFADWGPHPLAT
jgi:Tol biopolymer transport system component